MSIALVEEEYTRCSLNVETLSIFAKASYLKKYLEEDEKYGTAQEALTAWASEKHVEVSGWTSIEINGKDQTDVGTAWGGFAASAFKNEQTKEILITYRGTDSPLDILISDAQIFFGLTPQQAGPAVSFFENIASQYEGYNISITGHSLGGALAQYVASLKHVPAVTFNAPGVDVPAGGTTENIINYVNMNDFVGCLNTHIGETRYFLPEGMYADSTQKSEDGSEVQVPVYEFKPHSAFVNKDFSKYITLPEGVKWTFGMSLALWGYDKNNTDTVTKALLSPFVLKKNLNPAVTIIESYFGNYGRLDDTFYYRANNESYIIGSKNSGTIFGYHDADDIIWGNQGADNIRGLYGNDQIFGGGGNDVICGDQGNDYINGGSGHDYYWFYTGDGQDTIAEVEETKKSCKNVNYITKRGSILIDGQRLIGGNYDSVLQKFVALETGVSYEWGGINNSDLKINYGENDSINLRGFKNGDLGIIFDHSTTLDKNDIINQLKRDSEVPQDLLKDNIADRDIPKLQYYDTSLNKRYDVINSETTEKIKRAYGTESLDGLIDSTGTYMLLEEGQKISLNYTPVDTSVLVEEMQKAIRGEEQPRSDLPIQTDIYIPKSSSEGSPTLKDVQNIYATDKYRYLKVA